MTSIFDPWPWKINQLSARSVIVTIRVVLTPVIRRAADDKRLKQNTLCIQRQNSIACGKCSVTVPKLNGYLFIRIGTQVMTECK